MGAVKNTWEVKERMQWGREAKGHRDVPTYYTYIQGKGYSTMQRRAEGRTLGQDGVLVLIPL